MTATSCSRRVIKAEFVFKKKTFRKLMIRFVFYNINKSGIKR